MFPCISLNLFDKINMDTLAYCQNKKKVFIQGKIIPTKGYNSVELIPQTNAILINQVSI